MEQTHKTLFVFKQEVKAISVRRVMEKKRVREQRKANICAQL